jgi:hypothetical protein
MLGKIPPIRMIKERPILTTIGSSIRGNIIKKAAKTPKERIMGTM